MSSFRARTWPTYPRGRSDSALSDPMARRWRRVPSGRMRMRSESLSSPCPWFRSLRRSRAGEWRRGWRPDGALGKSLTGKSLAGIHAYGHPARRRGTPCHVTTPVGPSVGNSALRTILPCAASCAAWYRIRHRREVDDDDCRCPHGPYGGTAIRAMPRTFTSNIHVDGLAASLTRSEPGRAPRPGRP